MKLNGKKVLALVLAMAMMLPMLGVGALAVTADYENEDFEWDLEYDFNELDDNWVDLEDLVAELLEYEYNDEIDIVDVYIYTSDAELEYGTIDGRYYTVDLSSAQEAELIEDYYLSEASIVYKAWDDYNDTYTGDLDIDIVAYGRDFVYDLEGKTEYYLGDILAEALDKLVDVDDYLDYVEFIEDRDNDCGTLYADDEYTPFDDEEKYYYKPDRTSYYDLEELYFEPDGSEGEFILTYYATPRYGKDFEGTITLKCGGALLVKVDLDSDDTYTFDYRDFQYAVDDWDDDYELIYIDNVKLSDSSDGDLYYDYDEDDRTHDDISGTEEYYVDETEDDVLDYITYVPAKTAKGKVTVTFDACVNKPGSSSTRAKDIPGVLEITVDQAASITIEAEVGELVEIDPELFQEYLEEDLDSTRYDVDHVEITGAPRSKAEGYLYCDDEKLDGRGDKIFYADPGRDDYDLYLLEYMAGTEADTYSATFTVYYYSGSTLKSSSEGTLEFVVEESTGPVVSTDTYGLYVDAADTLDFADYMNQMMYLGDVKVPNQIFAFTQAGMPKNGRLYYKYGTAEQELVKANEPFASSYAYTATSTKKLADVSYVPSYSASKVMFSDTIGIVAYASADGTADKLTEVQATLTVNVQPAQVSKYFTDMKTSAHTRYADSADFLKNRNITQGTGTGTTFSPDANLSRAQFVTFLWRAAGSPAPKSTVNPFKDVSATSASHGYAYQAILWAVEQKITSGTSATTFSPDAAVTHEQLLTFLYRYKGDGSAAAYVPFTDVASASDYAQTPIKWATGKSIITGNDGLLLRPTANATRATMALWLHRMLTL